MRETKRRLPGLMACAALALLAAGPAGAAGSQTAEAFPLELDHVLIWVAKGAPEAKALEDAGLQKLGKSSRHAGQGTASTAFLFENAYLELIWIEDRQEASKNGARSGIDMVVRADWKRTGASPFGVGLHRASGATAPLPFPAMDYHAEWMGPDASIQFARTVADRGTPMYFVVPESMAIPVGPSLEKLLQEDPEYAKLLKHRLGLKRITGVKIVTTGKDPSSTGATLTRGGVARIEAGKSPLMEVTFDKGAQNKILDLRNHLPLVLKY